MKEHLTLDIKKVRSINNATIEINKINVIGGVNGSGKSTISKILYSFLKANSQDRKSYLFKEIIKSINNPLEYLIDENIDEGNIPDFVSEEDDYETIIRKYKEVVAIFKNHEDEIEKTKVNLSKLILIKFKDIINKLADYGENIDDFKDFSNVNDIFDKENFISLRKLMKKHDMKEEYLDLNNLRSKFSEKRYFNIVKKSLDIPKKFIDYYYKEKDNYSISEKIMNIILLNESFRGLSVQNSKSNDGINFYLDSNKDLNVFDYFFKNGFLNKIYYIDNVSILDFEEFNSKNMPIHKSELIEDLFIKESISISENEGESIEFKSILEKIEEIIKGEYFLEGHIFNTKIPFKKEYGQISYRNSKNEEPTLAVMGDNISSGIKQIGIIQILLLNNKLKKNSYLILDEPEVNLHPKWQFKFAEILVLLAKELNITLYINSHSPMFIESIDAFCEFYDMGEDINYYLSVKSEVQFKYDFVKINSNELYKIYDNLGSPYKLINQLKIRKRLNK